MTKLIKRHIVAWAFLQWLIQLGLIASSPLQPEGRHKASVLLDSSLGPPRRLLKRGQEDLYDLINLAQRTHAPESVSSTNEANPAFQSTTGYIPEASFQTSGQLSDLLHGTW